MNTGWDNVVKGFLICFFILFICFLIGKLLQVIKVDSNIGGVGRGSSVCLNHTNLSRHFWF